MTNAPSSPRAAWQDDAVLWQHGAFCRLAVPLSTPKDSLWSREAGGAGIAMEAANAAAAGEGLPLPGGPALRLLLLHVFTAALRGGSAAVEVGEDAAALASSLGLAATPRRLKELAEQAERLVRARLRVAEGKGAPLSVLDARRSGARSGPSGWRPVLHLTERFFASLQQGAVALDRGVVAALAGSALALDAYAWLAATMPEASADRPVLATWPELQQRFGEGGPSNAAVFRRAFSRSLAAVGAACPMLRFTVGRDGVELQQGAAVSLAASASEAAPLKRPTLEPDPALPEVPPVFVTVPPPMGQDVPKRDVTPAMVPAVPTTEVVDAAATEPDMRPRPNGVQAITRHTAAEARPNPEQQRDGGRIRLAPRLTGLAQSVWLRRGGDPSNAAFEVTPGGDYNPARRSLLILEPMVLQVQGFLQPRELERVAAWATANAGLIQDYWDGSVISASAIAGRVKSVTA